MKALFIVICLLLFPFVTAADDCGKMASSWITCERNEDCILTSDKCGWPRAAVNKLYAKEMSAYNSCMGASIDCPSWNQQRDPSYTASCVQKKCVVSEIAKPKTSENDCKKNGGQWMGTESGRGRITGCNMPTKDGEKSCSKGEDCESVCLPEGKCYGWKLYKGCGMYKGHPGVICVE